MENQWIKIENGHTFCYDVRRGWSSVSNFYKGCSPAFVKGKIMTALQNNVKVEAYLI